MRSQGKCYNACRGDARRGRRFQAWRRRLKTRRFKRFKARRSRFEARR